MRWTARLAVVAAPSGARAVAIAPVIVRGAAAGTLTPAVVIPALVAIALVPITAVTVVITAVVITTVTATSTAVVRVLGVPIAAIASERIEDISKRQAAVAEERLDVVCGIACLGRAGCVELRDPEPLRAGIGESRRRRD